MLHGPARFAALPASFARVFVQAWAWQNARMLAPGALLVSGQGNVCSIGPCQERHFVPCRQVLSRIGLKIAGNGALTRCTSNIEMTPLCKVEVTLPRVRGVWEAPCRCCQ